MKPKTIFAAIVLTLVLIILFNNKEEATFWLFGQIRTSKLIILAVFFLLGLVAGGFIFRRKKPAHPKEYSVNSGDLSIQSEENTPANPPMLSAEDEEYLRED